MSPSIDTPDALVLARYLAGDASPGEHRAVEHWLTAYPGERDRLAAIRDGVADPFGDVPAYDLDARVASVVAYSVRGETPVQARILTEGARPVARRMARWSLGRVVLAGAGTAFAIAVAAIGFRTPTARSSELRTYRTVAGQRATVTLADGSSVVLGYASELRVPRDFGSTTRTLHLAGEAYFTVSRSASAPFVVEAGNAATRVLGTAFIVRKYATDTAVRVMVSEGRVSVRATRDGGAREAVLDAATLGEVNDSGQIVVTPHIAVDDALDWTRGELVIRNARLRDVVADLERAYDLDIRLMDGALAERRFTFTASVQPESASDVLDAIAVALHAHYTRQGPAGRVVTFRLAPRATARPRHPSLPMPEGPSYGR